jgi:L-amino acid N-acyltransferase YncA
MSANTTPPLDEDLRIDENGPDGTAEAWLWWTHVPALPGERLGVIGGFSATTSAAAWKIFARAEAELRARGCTLAVGPMDGNTWRRYRLVTEPGTEPPFFMEPVNSPEWPEWWRSAAFEPLAEYYSAATEDLTTRDPRLDGVTARMATAGITIRALNPADFEADLVKIYEVSVASFQDNYLYTPLPRDAFLAQYRAIQARVKPELVLLAEQERGPVGYVFAVPDYAQAQRGEPVTTIIVKTLAVLPARTNAGLGALLLARVHEAAQSMGFTRAIHALMHETNKSRNLSARYAHTIRRYTLFAKRLTA